MSSNRQKHTKSDLLRELENLRAQLEDSDGADISADIPLLLDKVEKAVSAAPGGLAQATEPDAMETLRQAPEQAATDSNVRETSLSAGLSAGLERPNAHTSNPAGPAPGVLPGQQSLFDPPQTLPAEQSPSRPKALGENPFLPRHIRDRLQERRKALAEDIAEAATFFPRAAGQPISSAGPATADEEAFETLIDELVAEYLPRIEAELRNRLRRKLRQTRREKDSPDQC